MVNFINSKIKSNIITNLGISLCMVGVPIGMYLNHILPIVPWSPVLMFLSVLFIFSYKNLFLGSFPSRNRMFSFIIAFQFLMLFYGLLSDNKLTFQYISFHLYIIFLIIALSTNNNRINYNNVILTTFFLSTICTILGFFYLNSGIVTSAEAWELRQTESYTLDAFTIAIGAIINFLSALFLLLKKNKLRLILWLFILLDFLVFFMSTKRTPIFISMVTLFLFIYKMGSLNTKMLIKYMKYLFLLLIGIISLYFFSEVVRDTLDNFIYNFYNGVLNILGNTDVKDSSGSSILRYKAREWTYNYINNNFNFFNYLLGAGYMTSWIDNPVLQSYLDMGVLGLICYIYLVIIYPVKTFFKAQNSLVLYAMLLCVYNILSSYTSGNPYAYIKYTPIVLLAFVLNLKRHQQYPNTYK